MEFVNAIVERKTMKQNNISNAKQTQRVIIESYIQFSFHESINTKKINATVKILEFVANDTDFFNFT